MHAPPPLIRIALALAVALALAAAPPAPSPDPEPPGDTRGEVATPAVDLKKAEGSRVLAIRAAANQAISRNYLKQIGMAVHAHHDVTTRLPADLTGKGGKPLLSWRVAILPYIEQEKLYKQFRLDEPWDSRHNVRLLTRMPELFNSPRVRLKGKGLTVYKVFTGPDAAFGRARPLGLAMIPDGASNTLMAVESSDAVPWTKPADIPFDRKKALPDFGRAYGGRPLALMFDGTPRLLDLKKLKPETLKNAIDPADGNVLGMEWDDGAMP